MISSRDEMNSQKFSIISANSKKTRDYFCRKQIIPNFSNIMKIRETNPTTLRIYDQNTKIDHTII